MKIHLPKSFWSIGLEPRRSDGLALYAKGPGSCKYSDCYNSLSDCLGSPHRMVGLCKVFYNLGRILHLEQEKKKARYSLLWFLSD
jgi:hypothetical protein